MQEQRPSAGQVPTWNTSTPRSEANRLAESLSEISDLSRRIRSMTAVKSTVTALGSMPSTPSSAAFRTCAQPAAFLSCRFFGYSVPVLEAVTELALT